MPMSHSTPSVASTWLQGARRALRLTPHEYGSDPVTTRSRQSIRRQDSPWDRAVLAVTRQRPRGNLATAGVYDPPGCQWRKGRTSIEAPSSAVMRYSNPRRSSMLQRYALETIVGVAAWPTGCRPPSSRVGALPAPLLYALRYR